MLYRLLRRLLLHSSRARKRILGHARSRVFQDPLGGLLHQLADFLQAELILDAKPIGFHSLRADVHSFGYVLGGQAAPSIVKVSSSRSERVSIAARDF